MPIYFDSIFICVKISENFPVSLFDDETGIKLKKGKEVAFIPTLPATYEISFEVMMTSWAHGRGWHSILHLQNKASCTYIHSFYKKAVPFAEKLLNK